MVNATDYLETKILNDLLTSGSTYIALYLSDSPGDTGTANAEVSGGSYVRKAATWNVSGGIATLAAAILWSGMPAALVGGWAILDAEQGGNMLIAAKFTQAKNVAAGDSFSCDVGALTVTCD